MIFTHTPPTPDDYMGIIARAVTEVREAYIRDLPNDDPERKREHLRLSIGPLRDEFERLKRDHLDSVESDGTTLTNDAMQHLVQIFHTARKAQAHAEEIGLPDEGPQDIIDYIKAWMAQ